MSKKLLKIEKILDVALDLLKTEGDYGVTMRKVANLSDMSLSNVQYYFKTKNDLLIAMGDRYFDKCLTEMQAMPEVKSEGELNQYIKTFLVHGCEISEMCRIYREYWAISTRNEVVEAHLEQYYKAYFSVVSDKLKPIASNDAALSQTAAIFISTTEGYSVTARSIPLDHDTVVEMLTRVILDCLRKTH
ncbi:TPA: TetR/AcrR family transcriptional regulator [Vibrio alginolyticus]